MDLQGVCHVIWVEISTKIFVKFRKIFHIFSSSAEPEQGNSQLGLGGHLSISISNFYCGSGGQDHC